MLHGFATSSSEFHAKSSRIAKRITDLLTPEILHEFPDGIEFLYPDGPWIVEPPVGFGEDDNTDHISSQDDAEIPFRAWWYGLDTVNKYRGIEFSLSCVAKYIHGRPIHAIIGFSQGASLAGMVCSMLESKNNPDKIDAIRSQNLPVDDYLRLPGQERLRCLIGLGGYCGTLKYYGSLYRWPMQTPSCHAIAEFDAIVDNCLTMTYAHQFCSYELVHYYGYHYTPRDRASVESIARFALRNCFAEPAASQFPPAAATSSRASSDGGNPIMIRVDRSAGAFPVLRRARNIAFASRHGLELAKDQLKGIAGSKVAVRYVFDIKFLGIVFIDIHQNLQIAIHPVDSVGG
ncbi:hypothetical protein N7486_005745 [Penicillium sp. IBT 16267x]|nr:hypothetical protein N7486_005745 [Penicillium sp. IBT 16267x]